MHSFLPALYMNNPHIFTQALPNTPLTFRMVRVPGGRFHMGSLHDDPDAYDSEKPRHKVQLDGFWMAEYPVTQALWEAVIGNNPSHFKAEQRPVENVSWFDAVVFCNALSKLTERSPAYLTPSDQIYGWDGKAWILPNSGEVRLNPKANGYRLPTEAAWEYAAREALSISEVEKQETGLKYSGSDLLDQVGWYSENSGGETRDVGLLLPNALGLYDMSGNVYEWCYDWWDDYKPNDQKNPTGPEKGVVRVIRGGYWGYFPQFCRSAFRYDDGPVNRGHILGFRLSLQSVG
ncbi:MAG: formylglycine-generating enzyme family protein [Saprospiraceae bacterium]